MFIIGPELFRETTFSSEAELERVVEQHSKLLFGQTTIYLPKKMLVRTADGRGTVPDAFVVDYELGTWYLVEVELIGHGVWRHIVPQLTNQMVACLHQDTRNLLTDRVLEFISRDPELSREPGLQQKAVSILRRDPAIAIPIDATSNDLETWAQTQKLEVTIWVIQKFESLSNPERIAYQIPGDSEPSIVARPGDKSLATVRRSGSKNLAELIDEGLLEDGGALNITYRNRTFSGVVRREGIELEDGHVYAASEAAIRCYAKTGTSRPTENGWRVWKNAAGVTLNGLYDQLQAKRETTRPELETSSTV